MNVSTYRRVACAYRSRRGTANNSIRVHRPVVWKPQRPENDVHDFDRFLLSQSNRTQDYYSEAEVEYLSLHQRPLILKLEAYLERRVFRLHRWYNEKPSLNCNESLWENIQKLFEQRKQILLLETYHIVFKQKFNYCIAYLSVKSLLKKLRWSEEFSEVMEVPLTLAIASAMEFAEKMEFHSTQKSLSNRPKVDLV